MAAPRCSWWSCLFFSFFFWLFWISTEADFFSWWVSHT